MTDMSNQGFIQLTGANNGQPLYIRARNIVSMGLHHQEGSYVWTPSENFWVKETVEEIRAMLNEVHPDFM